jgi:methylenetetrahydrofolate dehydrogenase (NADP+) / methenyltetrahydrofolate cyclohydrolase
MIILDGKKLSVNIKKNIKTEIIENNYTVGLGILLVGIKSDSIIYVNMKKKACNDVGINNYDIELDEKITTEELIKEVEKMNEDNNIHGILIQLPLPEHIDTQRVLSAVSYEKDVDGFHTYNMGMLSLNKYDNFRIPCTPKGIIRLLDEYNIELKGKNVVVIGKSNIVGLPTSLLCLHRDATVTICHIETINLNEHTKNADILITATGVINLIKKENIKNGVIIIDVGINRIEDKTRKNGYRIVGDCDYESIKDMCYAITPVPGGVGPMTIAMLLENVLYNHKKFI